MTYILHTVLLGLNPMWIFYFFALIVIWLGIVSLVGGVRFLSYVRREISKPVSDFTPRVSLIAPCRGLDQGLRENIRALFLQNYPLFEIIFVTNHANDPAIDIIKELSDEFKEQWYVKSRIVIAGEAIDSGQKVHNLRAAVSEADLSSDAFVFVDSDARPGISWLRSLVAPLTDKQIGAATGYRWFIPERGGLSSHVRSVWNASIASALGARVDKNFCWGGATAILRSTFESLDMREQWRGTLSDDFALTRALRRAGLSIYFVPACLTACIEDCGPGELLEFTTRQLKITRVYAPHLWKAALLGSALFVTVFFGGIALTITRVASGTGYWLPLILICLIFLLGAGKAYLRCHAVRIPLKEYDAQLARGMWAQVVLWPFTSALYLYNSLCAGFSRSIKWRGTSYQLKSPTETVIMKSQN